MILGAQSAEELVERFPNNDRKEGSLRGVPRSAG
jgi:hypothetical protein